MKETRQEKTPRTFLHQLAQIPIQLNMCLNVNSIISIIMLNNFLKLILKIVVAHLININYTNVKYLLLIKKKK